MGWVTLNGLGPAAPGLGRAWAEGASQAKSKLSRKRVWGWIREAYQRPSEGSGGTAATCMLLLPPASSPDASLSPRHEQLLRGDSSATPGDTAGTCHLFTVWKYICRKPGSMVLLHSSSCVWG